MTDRQADFYILLAVLAWMLSCVHPAIGMLLQFPIIIKLVWMANMKTLPALMLLMLGRGNLTMFQGTMALRLGITLTPASCFAIAAFFFAAYRIVINRYDTGALTFAWVFWFPSLIPAAYISLFAKSCGLSGIWSESIMNFLIPAIYYWALSMGRSYAFGGRHYFVTRMIFLMIAINLLELSTKVFVFTFSDHVLGGCLFFCLLNDREFRRVKWGGFIGFLVAMIAMALTRRFCVMVQGEMDLESGYEYGSTFSRMAIVALSLWLAICVGKNFSRMLIRMIPIWIVVANIALVSLVVATQSGNKAKDVNQKFDNIQDRFKYKLYGDRAAVWMEGWKDATTPPYVFRDLREYLIVDKKGVRSKILPHNQFLTLLVRHGWWQGLVLALFIIWVQMRMCRAVAALKADGVMTKLIFSSSISVFCIVGTTGQSVCSFDLWANALVVLVLPGVAYGHWLWVQKQRRMGYANPLV